MWVTVSENLTFCLGGVGVGTTGSGGGVVGRSPSPSELLPDEQLHEQEEWEQEQSVEPAQWKAESWSSIKIRILRKKHFS